MISSSRLTCRDLLARPHPSTSMSMPQSPALLKQQDDSTQMIAGRFPCCSQQSHRTPSLSPGLNGPAPCSLRLYQCLGGCPPVSGSATRRRCSVWRFRLGKGSFLVKNQTCLSHTDFLAWEMLLMEMLCLSGPMGMGNH